MVDDISAQQKNLMKNWKKIITGDFSGRLILALTQVNKPKKFYSVENYIKCQVVFYNADVSQTNSQKHLGVVSDSKLTFHDHFDVVFTYMRKTIGLLCKLKVFYLGQP